MQYYLKSEEFWDHTLSTNKNLKPIFIILKDKKLEDGAKFECQEKCINKILVWINKNVKFTYYISCIFFGHV